MYLGLSTYELNAMSSNELSPILLPKKANSGLSIKIFTTKVIIEFQIGYPFSYQEHTLIRHANQPYFFKSFKIEKLGKKKSRKHRINTPIEVKKILRDALVKYDHDRLHHHDEL